MNASLGSLDFIPRSCIHKCNDNNKINHHVPPGLTIINILLLLFIDGICAGQCDEISVFPGSPRSRAGMGVGEVLNGEKAEIKLWQETKTVLAGHTEGAEKRPTERQNL